MSRYLLLVVLGWAAVSCGADSPELAAGVVHDSAGVRIVQLPVPARAPTLELAFDPTWQSLAASSGELVDVQVLADGRAVLLDRLSAAVIVLAPDGGELARMGRPGQGPGELSMGGLSRVLASESSLIVPDLMQQRLSRFALDGTSLGARSFPAGGGYAIDWQWGSDGSLAYRLLRPDGDLLFQTSGDALDTLYVFPGSEAHPNVLLPPVGLWALSKKALVVAVSDAWVVQGYDAASLQLRWIARGPVEPRPFSASDRSALAQVLVASAERETGGRRLTATEREGLLSQVAFPESAPLLAGLLLAPNGDVWVRGAQPVSGMGRPALRVGSADGYGGSEWVVLDSTGLARTRVRLPEGFVPRDLEDRYLYGIAEDALGIRRAARVVIPWAQGSPG